MPHASQIRILIVDDMRSMRALVRSSLHAFGCINCDEAGDGEEALAKMRVHPPYLIISDLNMPKLDGLGLLKAVRENRELSALPFIMLTSRGDTDLVRQAIALKVDNYLMKPFTMDGLRRKVEAVIGPLK